MRISLQKGPRLALVCCLALAFLAGGWAWAQENWRYSETEKIGFAFHKLAHVDPDYDTWIRNSKRYKESSPTKKVTLLQKEKLRLQAGFANYQPDLGMIHLKLDGKVTVSNYFNESQEKDAVTEARIEMPSLPDTYIAFRVGDVWIALVIDEIKNLTHMSFTPETYAPFAERMDFHQNKRRSSEDVTVDLMLRPKSVDTAAPIQLDGVEAWLMLVEVADFQVSRIRSGQKRIVTSYSAPWYVSDSQKELLRLYKQ